MRLDSVLARTGHPQGMPLHVQRWEQGTRKGCPYIPRCHMRLDSVFASAGHPQGMPLHSHPPLEA
jgi:transposase